VNSLLGCLLAVACAILWGISGVCAQYLFQAKHVDAGWLVTARLLICGSIFLGRVLFSDPSRLAQVWLNRHDAIRITCFGLFGMLGVQASYFFAIAASNAATATVLEYTGPAVIVVWLAFREKRLPTWIEGTSTLLAFVGVWLLVTHGSVNSLVVSLPGLVWGLISGAALAMYALLPVPLLKRHSASTVAGWGMFIGGSVLSIVYCPWVISGIWDVRALAALGFILLFGTLIPFYAYMKSLDIIGAHASSVFSSFEPVSATVVSVLFLGVVFGSMDWLGTLCIISTVLVLALSNARQEKLSSGLINSSPE
jgi:drug/metabolite transporter (DMT)-like permease